MGELQVIGGLRDKRSELVELVGRLEQQLADYRVSLTHLKTPPCAFSTRTYFWRTPICRSGSGFHGLGLVNACGRFTTSCARRPSR